MKNRRLRARRMAALEAIFHKDEVDLLDAFFVNTMWFALGAMELERNDRRFYRGGWVSKLCAF